VFSKHLEWPGVNFINILLELFCQYPFARKSQSQTVIREKRRNSLSYEKLEHEMLMKLTPGRKNDSKTVFFFIKFDLNGTSLYLTFYFYPM